MFLDGLSSRAVNLGNTPGKLYLGNGPGGLEVVVIEGRAQPALAELRNIWKARLAGRATPLLLVVLHGSHSSKAALCGPTGEPTPAFASLDIAHVERLCRAALAEPDKNAALRFLESAIPEAEEPLPGIRNEGLFATYTLRKAAPIASDQAKALLRERGQGLLRSLGYSIEAAMGPVSILRAGENRRALAVFLERDESPDLPNERFSHLSPVSYALTRAEKENLDWVLVSAGASLRIHPVGTEVGTGRRGRAETYTEIHLDLVSPSDAGYLWSLFSAESLAKDGSVEKLLDDSARYAADVGVKLRERIYDSVVPDLAMGILAARGLRRPKPADLAETYQMTLVYLFRLLFIAYAEDKELLPYKGNTLYKSRSLKQKAVELAKLKREDAALGAGSAWWDEIDGLFRAVDKGNGTWGVPAYNGGLFSRDEKVSRQGALLSDLQLTDEVLGPVLMGLLIEPAPEGWGPVDFRSLGVREFGTIYEGLLENELAIAEEDLTTKSKDKQYAPAGTRDAVVVRKGRAYLYNTSGARKSTGSYFTKQFAVEHLLNHALEPALKEHTARLAAMTPEDAAKAFFDFRVADIAMGSGHFLVAAVDRIERAFTNCLEARPLPEVSAELARLREAAEKALGPLAKSVTLEDTQLLRRQIARRCIYGVDLNEMAVDLARLAIWIHTFVPGLPLSFLDHNLVQGNALIGMGTIDEANAWMGEVAGSLIRLTPEQLEPALKPLRDLAGVSDANASEIARARKALVEAKQAVAPVAALFDILSAARIDDESGRAVHGDAGRWMKDLRSLPGSTAHQKALKVMKAIPPFHFPVAFPEVFLRKRSGFDVLLGNPPWEEATVEEDRFWARHHPGFHSLRQQEQENTKAKLRESRADLVRLYEAERAEAMLLRSVLTSGQYPGMGTGDPDVYKAFYWRFWELGAQGGGWSGIVLPRSAMVAKGSAEFREKAFRDGTFSDLTWLINSGGWVFDDVENRYTIVLAAFHKQAAAANATLPFRGPFRSRARYEDGLQKPELRFAVSDVGEWTDIWALPLLPTEDSGEVFAQLRKSPRLDARHGPWRSRPAAEFHATKAKPMMKLVDDQPTGYWPVFKGESFDLWEPDTGQYYAWGEPKKLTNVLYKSRVETGARTNSSFVEFSTAWRTDRQTLPCLNPRIAFRDVTRATDTRTIRAALLPGEVFLTNKAPYLLWPEGDEKDQAYLLGVLCSLSLDWYSRRFVEINLNFFILNPFPIPRPPRSSPFWARTVELAGRLAAPDVRFAKWAKAVGVKHGKLTRDEKDDMIHELDAVVAHLYGLTARQLRIVFDTFHEGWDYEAQLRETLRHFDAWRAKR